MASKWVDLFLQIIEKKYINSISCPFCKKNTIRFEYIQYSSGSNIGYMLVWCETCKRGTHFSNLRIPEDEPFIPAGAPIPYVQFK